MKPKTLLEILEHLRSQESIARLDIATRLPSMQTNPMRVLEWGDSLFLHTGLLDISLFYQDLVLYYMDEASLEQTPLRTLEVEVTRNLINLIDQNNSTEQSDNLLRQAKIRATAKFLNYLIGF